MMVIDSALVLSMRRSLLTTNSHHMTAMTFRPQHILLLILTPLILEPDPDHARIQARHLHQLLLHQRIRPRVRAITRPQSMQLLLVKDRSNSRRLITMLSTRLSTVAISVDLHEKRIRR